MSSEFAISPNFLMSPVQLLQANMELFLQYDEDSIIPTHVNEISIEYNHKKNKELIKFIISKNEFEATGLKEETLKRPKLIEDKELSTSRGIEYTRKSLREELDSINFEEWVCQSLFLEFINPEYNQISENNLREMLIFDKMSDFALGIYYNVVKDEYFRPYYALKPEIKFIDVSS